jgi:hypothetical protein
MVKHHLKGVSIPLGYIITRQFQMIAHSEHHRIACNRQEQVKERYQPMNICSVRGID